MHLPKMKQILNLTLQHSNALEAIIELLLVVLPFPILSSLKATLLLLQEQGIVTARQKIAVQH